MWEVFEKLREEKGVTAYKVCKDLGFDSSVISNWKAGRYRPKDDKRKKIAEYFGVTLEYLDTGIDTEKQSTSGEKYYFNDETAKVAQEIYENKDLRVLFDAARDASPEDLRTTYDMLMALKRKERGDDL